MNYDFNSYEEAAHFKNKLIAMFQRFGYLTLADADSIAGVGEKATFNERRNFKWFNEKEICDAEVRTFDGVVFTVRLPNPKSTAYMNYEHIYNILNPLNQSAKADNGKPKLTLVPRQIIWDIAEVREYGNRKYGDPNNWKTVEKERYRDAAYRHFMAYLDDPNGVDKESGISHLKHLACNIAFLCEMEDK